MTGSSPLRTGGQVLAMKVTHVCPPPRWGRIEVGVERVFSPSPVPSPPRGEGVIVLF